MSIFIIIIRNKNAGKYEWEMPLHENENHDTFK